MPKERSPAFQWYPADFESDENVRAMTLQECGAYIHLLNSCWLEQSIPDDIQRLARMLNITRRRMEVMWPQISRCFKPDGSGRLRHPRLDRERNKQEKYRKMKSEAGKKGAASRRDTKS